MRRVRKNDENHRSCGHVSFFLVFDNKKEIMSRSQKLLQELCWGVAHNQGKIDLNEQRLYELAAGILRFCVGLELFHHAWRSDELDVLRKDIFKRVQNMPEKIDVISQIRILESEIDIAITCLENIKIHSKNLELLCLYLENLRDGDFIPSANYNNNPKTRGMPIGK